MKLWLNYNVKKNIIKMNVIFEFIQTNYTKKKKISKNSNLSVCENKSKKNASRNLLIIMLCG